MNPPFNDRMRQQLSPDGGRRLAHAAASETLAGWAKTAMRLLRPRGCLTLIWRADGFAGVLDALTPGFGGFAVLPIYPKPGQDAIRIIVRATRSSRAPLRLLPGLTLNDRDGRPTPEAEAVLRGGRELALVEP
jgi:tRNA1(Val) A37 N6-methylase TrmN6